MEEEEKKQKEYRGNGKVVGTNGTFVAAERKEKQDSVQTEQQVDDLPF